MLACLPPPGFPGVIAPAAVPKPSMRTVYSLPPIAQIKQCSVQAPYLESPCPPSVGGITDDVLVISPIPPTPVGVGL